MPRHLGSGPEAVLRFNKAIIEATSDLAVAYKPNVAFYEAMGPDGWRVLSETLAAIPEGCLRIARCQAWRHRKYRYPLCTGGF